MIFQAGPAQHLAWLVVLAVFCSIFLQEQVLLPLENYGDPGSRIYHGNDLKHLYLGSRLLLRRENPYPAANLHLEASRVRHPEMVRLNPYVYPPFTGYFFSWLTLVDYETAKKIWFWGSQVLLIGSLALFLVHPSGCPQLPWLTVLIASTAFFFPLFRSTTAGQLNHVLLFLLSVVFMLWRNGATKLAGMVIGFAALIKVQPAFLMVWLIWKREWGAFLCSVLTVVVLILVPAVHFGLQPNFDYLGVLGDMAYGSSTWSDQGASFYVDAGNIGLPALLYRLFTVNPVTLPWLNLGPVPYLLCIVWALFVLGICLGCCRIQRRDEDPEMEMSTWILGMLLIPSLFWDHYLVLALPCWFTLLSRISQSGVGEGGMVLAAATWAVAGWKWKYFWATDSPLHGPVLLYLNAPLPAVIVLFFLCAWMARDSRMRPGLVD